MRILLATDLSGSADCSSEMAIAFARRWGQGIVLLHVNEPPTRLIGRVVPDVAAFESTLRERSLADLEAEARRLRARDVSVEVRFGQGEAAAGIADVAREVGAGLIVVGTHGRGGLERVLLGSVAHESLLLADRPVLIARGRTAPPGIEDWTTARRPLRVTLAVDRSPASAAAADWVSRIGNAGPLEVRLVHVYSPLVEAIRLGLQQGAAGQFELETELERELRAFLGAFLDVRKMPVKFRLSTARAGALVASESDPSATDLLVMGTSQRKGLRRLWLGSTAELALRRARVPVVCAPVVSTKVLDDSAREEMGKDDADDVC